MSPPREPDGLGTPKYPPFGFSTWYCRHGGGWCWRERKPSQVEGHVTSGRQLGSRPQAVMAVRLELAYRGGILPRPEVSDEGDEAAGEGSPAQG